MAIPRPDIVPAADQKLKDHLDTYTYGRICKLFADSALVRAFVSELVIHEWSGRLPPPSDVVGILDVPLHYPQDATCPSTSSQIIAEIFRRCIDHGHGMAAQGALDAVAARKGFAVYKIDYAVRADLERAGIWKRMGQDALQQPSIVIGPGVGGPQPVPNVSSPSQGGGRVFNPQKQGKRP